MARSPLLTELERAARATPAGWNFALVRDASAGRWIASWYPRQRVAEDTDAVTAWGITAPAAVSAALMRVGHLPGNRHGPGG